MCLGWVSVMWHVVDALGGCWDFKVSPALLVLGMGMASQIGRFCWDMGLCDG